jgi:hypothetical protein
MDFLEQIKETWVALGALGGAFATGAVLVLILGGFVGLPERHDKDMIIVSERLALLEETTKDLNVLVCILTNDRLDRPVEDCVE